MKPRGILSGYFEGDRAEQVAWERFATAFDVYAVAEAEARELAEFYQPEHETVH